MPPMFSSFVSCVLVIVATTTSGIFATALSQRVRRQSNTPLYGGQGGCVLPRPLSHGRLFPSAQRCPSYVSNPACRMVPGTFVPQGWELYYSCSPGYYLNSDLAVSVCTNGRWNPQIPSCAAEDYCSPLEALDLNIKCSYEGTEVPCNKRMKPKTTATPTCKSGFKPAYDSGYTSLTCLQNGQWDRPIFYCVRENLCPPLYHQSMNIKCILEEKEVPCEYHMEPGTVATPTCKNHYKPTFEPGYSQLTCLNNGHWDHSLFHCTAECGESKEVGTFRPLILEGQEAYVGAFPWHAGLYYRREEEDGDVIWEQKCGGSLISDQFVITAAHCVAGYKEADIRVGLGKFYRDWNVTEHSEAKRSVLKIIHPRDYSKKTFLFDVALLLLDKKIKFGEFIMPVCHGFLDGASYITNRDVYIVGWGRTEDVIDGKSSDKLLYNNVSVVPAQICQQQAPSVFPTFEKFCAVKKNHTGGSTAQPGDSGGGLTGVYDGLHYLFGIVSTRYNEYSLFTNITWPFNMIWIENQMRKYHPNFSWLENDKKTVNKNPKACVLPEASNSRVFCSLAEGCEDCDIYSTKCFVPPGTQVDRIKVVCAPGYNLRTPYRGADVALCLADGSWYPQIPECVSIGNDSTYALRTQFVPGYPWSQVTWQEAKDNCEAKGYKLATIKTRSEQEWFEVAVASQFKDTFTKPNNVWIGLRDEILYKWLDGSVLEGDIPKWLPGQPDNAGGTETCVELVAGIGLSPHWRKEKPYQMNDNTCSGPRFYFCEESTTSNNQNNNAVRNVKYTPGNPWRQVTWHEARDNCAARRKQLASIKSQEEQKLFEETADKRFKDLGTQASGIWIGLRYERKFRWVDDTVLGQNEDEVAKWLPNEPSGNQHCVTSVIGAGFDPRWARGKPYQWNDDACATWKHYFCEDSSATSPSTKYIPGDPWKKMGWPEARKNCIAKGYDLSLIKTEDEQDQFIRAVIKQFKEIEEIPSNIWIGLRDERRFEWVDGSYLGGTEGEVAPWKASQPDNADHYEYCVEAWPECVDCSNGSTYVWNDITCSAKNYYFCKEKSGNNYVPGDPWSEVHWEQARDNCNSKGYQLAIIKTPEQINLFETAVKKKFKDEGSELNNIWLGLRDERTFEWLDGTVLGTNPKEKTPWLPNEPNNAGGDERCIQAVAGDDLTPKWPNGKPYQWDDDFCSLKNYYFCKKPIFEQFSSAG